MQIFQFLLYTEEENTQYWSETTCQIYRDKFFDKDRNHCKVQDHCHYARKYWGATHLICNLHYNFIPIIAQKLWQPLNVGKNCTNIYKQLIFMCCWKL